MDRLNNPVRLLLVDDDEDDYLIIRRLIGKVTSPPYKLEWLTNAEEAETAINECRHDAYLIDYRLGNNSGLELLKRFNLIDRLEPFIILTGIGDERIERRAMNMGVADYLVKGSFDSELLSRVIRHAMQRKEMETQRVEQLMELNRSKDEFIAIASHQLRTPATAVKQYVSMVIDGYAGDITKEQAMLLKSAYESNERQIQIVNDILRVAKLDLEKIVLQKANINAVEKVENVVSDLAPQLHERSQTIIVNLPDREVPIYVDAEYTRMALSNILDNASKYTPEGKTIRINVEEMSDNVAISIIDEGVGIADEDMDKLFRKFSRISNPLSDKVGGTGLGLYWSKEIIELHGGSVKVASKVGKGTTFTVSLPKKK